MFISKTLKSTHKSKIIPKVSTYFLILLSLKHNYLRVKYNNFDLLFLLIL